MRIGRYRRERMPEASTWLDEAVTHGSQMNFALAPLNASTRLPHHNHSRARLHLSHDAADEE